MITRKPTRLVRESLRAVGPALIALLAGASTGCSLREQPGYNPYAPPGGDPPLLRRAEAVLDVPEHVARDVDMYLENAVY